MSADTPEDSKEDKASTDAPKKQNESEKPRSEAETTTTEQPAQQQASPKSTVSRPVIGTPVGRPIVGAPVSRPTIGTPVGKPVGGPAAPKPPTVGTSSTPASPSTARPAIGTPASSVSRPSAAPSIGSPSISTPGAPSVPKKGVVESKQDVSRRNFLRGLAVLGGVVTIAQFGLLGPYLQGTVKGTQASGSSQQIRDSNGRTINASDIAVNDWKTFVWPYTGNGNLDNDTFSQYVVIHLPKDFTAPSDVSARDPVSGDTFIAFSRVCVHLWCLWSYVPNDKRMECPCHGSQYVPGTGQPYNMEPGTAVLGPASLQTPPNNQLPILQLSISSDGSISTPGVVFGQIGCGQKC